MNIKLTIFGILMCCCFINVSYAQQYTIFDHDEALVAATSGHVSGGPVSWWMKDAAHTFLTNCEDAVDGNNGTISGSLSLVPNAHGDANSAYDMGAGTQINVPDSPNLDFIGDFTVLIWWANPAYDPYGSIFEKGGTFGTAPGFAITYAMTPQRFYLLMGNGTTDIIYNTGLLTWSGWKQVGIVRNAGHVFFVNNGVLVDTGSTLSGSVGSSHVLHFGFDGSYEPACVLGQVSGARVYNRALSAEEVLDIYNTEE